MGLAVAARALVNYGDILLCVLGTQVTADVLTRWLRVDEEAGLVAKALVVLEKLLAAADGPAALWNCLNTTVALIDLAINDGQNRMPGTPVPQSHTRWMGCRFRECTVQEDLELSRHLN